tara:strand:- start:798 stop:1427 length:630 start_codon:yes stop_codon:yes gene_type:complete
MTDDSLIPNYWEEACLELSVRDPVLKRIIDTYKTPILTSKGDLFFTLIRSIVGQQISVFAADAVWSRLEKLLGEITPKRILNSSDKELKKCGLSLRKVEYMKGISKTWEKNFSKLNWNEMSDNDVKTKLISLRGVGPWTAEMILIFSLLRPDIFPVDDIGAIRAIEKLYNKGEKMSKKDLINKAKDWIPWRTVATWYLWRTIDDEPVGY